MASPTSTAPDVARSDDEAAAHASNAFGMTLYPKLAGEPQDNVAFSPASISVALSMTAAGARTRTEREMHDVLSFPPSAKAVHRGWRTTMQRYAAIKDSEVAVANRLYGQRGRPIAPAFLSLNADLYGAPFLEADFVAAPDRERKRINGWVAERTRDRIPDLIPPNGIKRNTRLVLANALYFKSAWASPFDPRHSVRGDFAGPRGTLAVDFMEQVTEVAHAASDGAIVAQFPYKGGDFAALFVMPEKGRSLADVERTLNAERFVTWTSALSAERRRLRLPRFEIEPGDAVELSSPLKALGMTSAFGDGADFSGIAPGLYIDEVYHKAFVSMNEEGTEAAAATAVVMAESGAMPLPQAEELAFDRPFLFFVRDTKSGLVLFAGRVATPKSSA